MPAHTPPHASPSAEGREKQLLTFSRMTTCFIFRAMLRLRVYSEYVLQVPNTPPGKVNWSGHPSATRVLCTVQIQGQEQVWRRCQREQ